MNWPYYTLDTNGVLLDEEGFRVQGTPAFVDVAAAEAYLEANDWRGSVQTREDRGI